ncbi:MAG: (E)-4-hydroxy-3-methylbut-2-enyl-diphosphate synthase [Bacteroidales bacterium]|jgi:(E)-4-hydroxy-3-methylbut-2-enyl-diphosphate synthase|nr:(E)-4-hydroxy-3-methylbut-2-enyl-diphosphate synthase [Bacteroidales bacterium]MDX9770929.1 (E)-4-hydroxy-3-methylbut-2-enyl-diphosphate synthase [Tenuifilaceae bacterium]
MNNLQADIYNTSTYKRKPTLEVNIGGIALGGSNPIRVQTMTTTNTNQIEATVEQCISTIKAGAEYVRLTTQGVKEAQSLGLVKQELRQRGYNTPLIADIHFNPAAAMEAAQHADKIRINPGNFSDKSRTSTFTFTDAEYGKELQRAESRFLELLAICKQNDVTIRIGVNHGSLSQRIMSRYGDTPIGMAHSAMEFVRICSKHNHHKVVVSMKSSNTRVMVQATRHLYSMMRDENLNYPIHLGVTEAGEGEDGRIKSAVGIGALLVDGIGDTIRVSLTEEPANEIPVAQSLVNIFAQWQNVSIPQVDDIPVNPFEFTKIKSKAVDNIGGDNPPIVMAYIQNLDYDSLAQWGWLYDNENGEWKSDENAADYIYVGDAAPDGLENSHQLPLVGTSRLCRYHLVNLAQATPSKPATELSFIEIDAIDITPELVERLKGLSDTALIIAARDYNDFYALRNAIFRIITAGLTIPIVASLKLRDTTSANLQIQTSAIAGPLFIDGLADGLMLTINQPADVSQVTQSSIRSTAFGILQASRVRITKTEFISCPGCGRTLFNLNQTLLKVKQRLAHLKGLKIGVMGCIVNGPGEMADADYGYVGSGPGKVTLYRKQEVVKKNIPEDKAVDELIELIKLNGDWVDG